MIKKYGLFAVWIVATLATFVTLYYSEIAHIAPTILDWYERICLYPLVIIAGQASWYGDYKITPYLLPQTVVGFGISLFHILLQETSWFHYLPCCAVKVAIGIEPVSRPMIMAVSFLLMTIVLAVIRRSSKSGAYDN